MFKLTEIECKNSSKIRPEVTGSCQFQNNKNGAKEVTKFRGCILTYNIVTVHETDIKLFTKD